MLDKRAGNLLQLICSCTHAAQASLGLRSSWSACARQCLLCCTYACYPAAQVIPSEFGAHLPLLFPFYRGYWRDGDVSSVPTLPEVASRAYKASKGYLLQLRGRQQAYHRLVHQSSAARATATHGASARVPHRAAGPDLQPWVADDGSTAARRQPRGRVLAQMQNLRKVKLLRRHWGTAAFRSAWWHAACWQEAHHIGDHCQDYIAFVGSCLMLQA